jgi:hypothetical protein
LLLPLFFSTLDGSCRYYLLGFFFVTQLPFFSVVNRAFFLSLSLFSCFFFWWSPPVFLFTHWSLLVFLIPCSSALLDLPLASGWHHSWRFKYQYMHVSFFRKFSKELMELE